jgi:single-strand DNA-binding protein
MFQRTTVIGHLGKDPEMRYTPSGVPVTSFNVATSRKWTNANGEQQEKTTWFRVTCWRKLAELTAQYCQKGKLVLVEGDIEASTWTDKEGNARATLELTATNVRFLSGRGEGGEGGEMPVRAAAGAGGNHGDSDFPANEDEIPF